MIFTKLCAVLALSAFFLLTGCLMPDTVDARSLEEILYSGTLRVGARVKPGKMAIDRNGKKSGFQYELALRFAKELGVELEMIPIKDANAYYATADGKSIIHWQEISEKKEPVPEPLIFTSGRIDLAAESLTYYPWKERFMRLVIWTTTWEIFFSRRDTPIRGPSDLAGKRILIRGNTSYERTMRRINAESGGSLNVSYSAKTDLEEIQKILLGEYDVSLVDAADLLIWLRHYPSLRPGYAASEEVSLAWALPRESRALHRAATDFFRKIQKNGVFETLWRKTYGQSVDEYRRLIRQFPTESPPSAAGAGLK